MYLDTLRTEPDRDVQKAVAWMLRDLSGLHRELVLALLAAWAKAAASDTRRMIRAGMTKLSPADQVFLRGLESGKLDQ